MFGARTHVVFVTAYGEHALAAFDEGAVDYVLKPIGMERLARALERVPADQRAAVELRVVEGLEYAEIAEQLGVKAATARVRVFRGLAALRSAMEQEEAER